MALRPHHTKPPTQIAVHGRRVLGKDDQRNPRRPPPMKGMPKQRLHEQLTQSARANARIDDQMSEPRVASPWAEEIRLTIPDHGSFAVRQGERLAPPTLPFAHLPRAQRPCRIRRQPMEIRRRGHPFQESRCLGELKRAENELLAAERERKAGRSGPRRALGCGGGALRTRPHEMTLWLTRNQTYARDWSRTSTALRPQAPQACASANSATRAAANLKCNEPMPRVKRTGCAK